MSIELVIPFNYLILCRPLLLLPSIFPSIRVFSNESALCIRWPKYWSFSFNINPSNEHSGLISFRMNWLDLLAVQAILKSLLQHHSSKASILRCSAFFTVQLSHPYMTTRKTIALTGSMLGSSHKILVRQSVFLWVNSCSDHDYNIPEVTRWTDHKTFNTHRLDERLNLNFVFFNIEKLWWHREGIKSTTNYNNKIKNICPIWSWGLQVFCYCI